MMIKKEILRKAIENAVKEEIFNFITRVDFTYREDLSELMGLNTERAGVFFRNTLRGDIDMVIVIDGNYKDAEPMSIERFIEKYGY